mmetsp:Transcript_28921/g.46919  ORF Transcript_28921/g.46919 Transcript_28921/m.46919 type:complete len:546 (-) Transcript_28921:24-1661(-)
MMPWFLALLLCCICTRTKVSGFSSRSSIIKYHHRHTHGPKSTTSLSYAIVYPDDEPSEPIDPIALDLAEDANREVTKMMMWAEAMGVQRGEGCTLSPETNDMNKDVHVVAKQDLPNGSPVFYVPEELILSSNKAMVEFRYSDNMVEEFLLAESMEIAEGMIYSMEKESEIRHFYLMLKILKEVEKGKDSAWFHWLDSLPRFYSNAVSMSPFCLLCLPPLMKKLAEEERENVNCLVSSIKMVPFLSDLIKDHPRDICNWAYQVAYTRSIETEDGDLRIVPVGDYFNHGSEYTEIDYSFDDEGNYYSYTSYDVPAGSSLRISYADPKNPSFLMTRYGFLDKACPASFCKIMPDDVNEEMVELGYSYDRMLFYSTGEVAEEVWDVILYSNLGLSGEIEDQQALMNAYRQGDSDTKTMLHEKHYQATSTTLMEHIDMFLEELDKLIAKANTVGSERTYVAYEHPRLPLIIEHNIFVRDTFLNVRNRYFAESNTNWIEATRVTVMECNDEECAQAECVQDLEGNYACEGGLGINEDGSERATSKDIIASY